MGDLILLIRRKLAEGELDGLLFKLVTIWNGISGCGRWIMIYDDDIRRISARSGGFLPYFKE